MSTEKYGDYEQPNYLLPADRDGRTITQFIGAVRSRIADRQKSGWSRFIGAGFVAEDIKHVMPNRDNLNDFSLHYGHRQQMELTKLNLYELQELLKWLQETWPEFTIL